MSKITALTEAQRAKFPEYVDKWTKIGLCTEPANREVSERAIRGLYALAGLSEPKIIWLPCPLSAALAACAYARIRNGNNSAVDSAVRSAVGSAVNSAVYSAVDSVVHSAVYSAVDRAVDSSVDRAVDRAVHRAVDRAVDRAVHSAVHRAVGSAVGSAVDSAVNSAGRAFFGGSLWAAYPAWADYFNRELAISIDRNYLDLAENCGFYWTLDNVCLASERPCDIRLEDGRLHSTTGMAIRYPSGWGLYCYRGIQVPGEWVTNPASLTPQAALTWENAEQRRAACEILGWHNVLDENNPDLNCRVIDEDMPHIGKLLEMDLPDAPGQRFLKFTCGTGRTFMEPVNDRQYDTALKANAAGNGWRGVGDPNDAIPFIRT